MSDAADTSPKLPDDIGTLKAIIGVQNLEIERLKEQLRLAAHKRFGSSSEKAGPDQLGLFNEAETLVGASDAEAAPDDTITIPEHKRAKGGRKPLSDDLPRVRIEHDIAETEKLCPCGSGHARPKIGEMIAEQADIVPARVQVLQHVRFKYGPCHVCDGVFPETAAGAEVDADDARPVIAAPLPPQPLPKSIASPRTCAFVTTAKYADGLPLYRLEKILKRYGLDVSRGTLAQWMIRLGDLIVPLMNLMEEVQLSYDVLQMDETTVQVLKEDGRKAQTKSRMWVRRGGPPDKPVILFNYEPTRSGKIAWRLTEDFNGYLQSDGYSGYTAVGKRLGLVHVGCLAHARRNTTDPNV